VWWYTPVIPALGRMRLKDHEIKPSLGYTVRLCVKNMQTSQALVVHAYNPSYSGAEILKLALANSPQDPITKKCW
jgi:hypothetical protein